MAKLITEVDNLKDENHKLTETISALQTTIDDLNSKVMLLSPLLLLLLLVVGKCIHILAEESVIAMPTVLPLPVSLVFVLIYIAHIIYRMYKLRSAIPRMFSCSRYIKMQSCSSLYCVLNVHCASIVIVAVFYFYCSFMFFV